MQTQELFYADILEKNRLLQDKSESGDIVLEPAALGLYMKYLST